MVRAKDFWNYLCTELRYTFFSGIPCLNLKILYDGMSSKVMHYIPAVDINTALGISSGVCISGIKSGIILHINELYDLLRTYNHFNKLYKVPILFIIYCEKDGMKMLSSNRIPYVILNDDFKSSLNKINNKLENKKVPCALVIREDMFK